jgi:nucleotide-binding universal stress UspA family protein
MKMRKILIAYDGSRYAKAAINELGRAGLPAQAELLIASVYDATALDVPVSEFDLHSLFSQHAEMTIDRARLYRQREIRKIRRRGSRAAAALRQRFPGRKIDFEVLHGQPAEALLERSANWKPDLIIAGSQSRSTVGQFFLGSVSNALSERAECSVRVVRAKPETTSAEGIRMILGTQSVDDGRILLEAMGRREWPAGTELRLLVIEKSDTSIDLSSCNSALNVLEGPAERLRAAGLHLEVDAIYGNAKSILRAAAEEWAADALFLTATSDRKGLSALARNLLTRARRTVEVVRFNASIDTGL